MIRRQQQLATAHAVRPRMCTESIEQLRTKLASETGCDVKNIIIAMIKIGEPCDTRPPLGRNEQIKLQRKTIIC